ncbi:hypothetical protein EIP91_003839 [Steccherinum ochraceum]|uniref:CNH domain-containing protein n=1 Tax=Steccherinum ochraceum TaxID=92696 RepID=A0A4V2MW27_9APHY|nr:hypothetical protein EIP91_003839 [Steccherinum ochraceum]
MPDVSPYQLQLLVASVSSDESGSLRTSIGIRDIRGVFEWRAISVRVAGWLKLKSYTLLSRQSLPNDKPIDEIVLVGYLAKALVLSDRTVHLYTLPALDSLSASIKPIRNVITLAVDELQLRKFAASGYPLRGAEPLDFCVVKRSSIALYGLKEKLTYRTEMPFSHGVIAKRAGHHVCIADKGMYHMIDLNAASSFPMLPVSQAEDDKIVKPLITVIKENEFLLLSWTGQATMGVFITGDGDPVRGTLEWAAYPESITLDYPYITAMLPSRDIEIHNIETQALVQSIPAPPQPPSSPTAAHANTTSTSSERSRLVFSVGGFAVPSSGGSESKLRLVKVPLVRKKKVEEVVDAGEAAETESASASEATGPVAEGGAGEDEAAPVESKDGALEEIPHNVAADGKPDDEVVVGGQETEVDAAAVPLPRDSGENERPEAVDVDGP